MWLSSYLDFQKIYVFKFDILSVHLFIETLHFSMPSQASRFVGFYSKNQLMIPLFTSRYIHV